ncbi:MAG: hypothetical protein ABII64_06325 [Elusimicrobiota bacterium]
MNNTRRGGSSLKKLLITSAILAAIAQTGYCVEFESPRAFGMGQAFSALNSGVDSVYYNPAGLMRQEMMELKMDFGSMYESGRIGFSGGGIFSWPLDMLGGNPVAVHANKKQIEGINVQEAGFTIAGNIFSDNFRWGTTLKWRSDASPESTSLILADFGVQSEWSVEKIQYGIGFKNLFSGNDSMAKITPVLGLGYPSPAGQLTTDMSWVSNKMYMSGGWEKGLYSSLLVMRLGYFNSEKSYATIGLSSYLWPVGFDTAFALPVNDKDSGYFQFSLRYRFGGEHFSEIYMNRAIEKAAALEQKIKRLKARKSELDKSMDDSMFVPEKQPEEPKPSAKPAAPPPPKPTVDKPRNVERTEAKPKKPTWPQSHKVEENDTLRDIAQRYYDDPGKWQLIYRANEDKVIRGRPQAGADLVIPEP